MVYNPNANWTAEAAKKQKFDRYFVTFDDVADTLFSTGRIKTPTTTTRHRLLQVPGQIAQKLSQAAGRASLSTVSLEFIDDASAVVNTLFTQTLDPIINARVLLFGGTEALVQADYAQIFIGQITNFEVLDNGRRWKIIISDPKRQSADEIFVNADATQSEPFNTTFAADATAGDGVITITSGSSIRVNDNLYIGPSTAPGFLGDEELIEVRALPRANGLVFDMFINGTIASDYKAADPIRWATSEIKGNPINIMHSLLTGNFADASFPVTTKGLVTGLGIAAADIDSPSFTFARDTFLIDETWRFVVRSPVVGFRFVESKLFRFTGYPIIRGDGKIGFRAYGPPTPADAIAGLPAITESDVLTWSVQKALNLHFNKFQVGLDSDEITGSQQILETVEDTQDQTDSKEIRQIVEKSTGFRTPLFGSRIAATKLMGLLTRFGEAPTQYVLTTDLTVRAYEIGDVAELTHSKIPNFTTGGLGVTDLRLEVVEKKEDFRASTIKWILQDANFPRPSWIAPSAAPDYGSATEADKEFGHIAPPTGNFADGKPPFTIA